MIVIVIGLLRTNLSGLYRHQRGLGFTWSRLQEMKHNIQIAKLAFHAKESPIQTRAEVLSLVSSRFNSPDIVHSPAVRIPPYPGLPQSPRSIPIIVTSGLSRYLQDVLPSLLQYMLGLSHSLQQICACHQAYHPETKQRDDRFCTCINKDDNCALNSIQFQIRK